MDHLSNFIATQNVLRFTEQLRSGGQARGSHMRSLRASSRRSLTAMSTSNFQQAQLATLERSGRDSTVASSVLQNLMQIQTVYKQYRLAILTALDRNEL
jgi:hypothetical protein